MRILILCVALINLDQPIEVFDQPWRCSKRPTGIGWR